MFLWEITNREMKLSEMGKIIKNEWTKTSSVRLGNCMNTQTPFAGFKINPLNPPCQGDFQKSRKAIGAVPQSVTTSRPTPMIREGVLPTIES
ncbi:MAG: hypothetical protein A3K09_06930 [Nitrospinae bacterium RIFCSPLOWO2_12_FULL_47_7]|nr:MAG: hypothetical protein A3K09_06930 [Nitrospinae bacterium RIFCSPLOWO2_12_FULL_47_7]